MPAAASLGRQDGQRISDTTGSAQGAVDAATKLVNVENVVDIVGALMSAPPSPRPTASSCRTGVDCRSRRPRTSPDMTTLRGQRLGVPRRAVGCLSGPGALAKLTYGPGRQEGGADLRQQRLRRCSTKAFADSCKELGGAITAEVKHEEKQPSARPSCATLAKRQAGGAGHHRRMPAIPACTLVEGSRWRTASFKRFVGTDGLRDNLADREDRRRQPEGTHSSPRLFAARARRRTSSTSSTPRSSRPPRTRSSSARSMTRCAWRRSPSSRPAATDRAKVRDAAASPSPTAPGEVGRSRRLGQAVELIKAGKDIDYTGATELDGVRRRGRRRRRHRPLRGRRHGLQGSPGWSRRESRRLRDDEEGPERSGPYRT